MRKLKIVKQNSTIKASDEEIIFFGILAVCKKTTEDYITLLNTSNDFWLSDNGAQSPRKTIEAIKERVTEIMINTEKTFWNDMELYKVKGRIANYFPILEATTHLMTREDINNAKISIQDYEILTTTITTREFLRDEMEFIKNNSEDMPKERKYLTPEICEIAGKLITRLSKFTNFMLNEIYFGNPPKVDKKKQKKEGIIKLDVLINDAGVLINKTGYYSAYEIQDEEGNKYCAGLTSDGHIYVLNSDAGEHLLNLQGFKLEWKNTTKKKTDTMSGLYKVGNHEIVTNIRRHSFEELIKDVNQAGIENIEIIKTLIEMKGYMVCCDKIIL